MSDNNILSIGMIVYNEEQFMSDAIQSLLSQTYTDFTLEITNNGSTDSSGQIAENFAKIDTRVKVIHFESNNPCGYGVIDKATTKYYMWAAGHDYYAPTFIEKCLNALESDPSVVLAYPRAKWFRGNTVYDEIPAIIDTRGIPPVSRPLVVMHGLVEAYQQYGIYRRKELHKLIKCHVVGFDHVRLTELAQMGSFALIDEPLFFMRKSENWGNWEVYRKKHFPNETDGAKAFLQMINAYMSIADKVDDPIDKELFKMAFFTASLLRYRCNLIPFNESVHSLYSRPGFEKVHETMTELNRFIQNDLQSMYAGKSNSHKESDTATKKPKERFGPESKTAGEATSRILVQPDLAPRKILWVRTDSIGDAVLSMSMLPHVKSNYADANITVLCQDHIAELYESCPYVDALVTFNKARAYTDEEYRKEISTTLYEETYDLVLNSVFSREPLTDIFSLDATARQRIAFHGDFANRMTEDFRSRANPLYSSIIPNKGEYKLELERHRDFLAALGIDAPQLSPVIWTTPEDAEFADALFKKNGLVPDKTIALFAGAQAEARTYDKYGLALAQLCKEDGYSVIALGSSNDSPINEKNLADLHGTKTLNLCGKTTLRQSAEILRRCRLAVGAETSMAHMACAVGTPNVILLGGGHFGRFMPYSNLTSAVCIPLECYCCNWACRYELAHCVKGTSHLVISTSIRQTLENNSDKPRIFLQDQNLWYQEKNFPSWKITEIFQTGSAVDIIPISSPISAAEKRTEMAYAPHGEEKFAVTAIVSTYNSEDFIRECLEDLLNQTIGDKLEIIVVDAASPQNEGRIVEELQRYSNNIRYIRTQERIGIYAAWNLAIKMAKGTFITTFSTNDRLSKDAYAVMMNALEENPDVKLVYGDTYLTETPHETFEKHTCTGVYRWPEYSYESLLEHCSIGPHPMWRREIHETIGYFDEEYLAVGDQEMWLRIGEMFRMLHIPVFTGLFWDSPDSMSNRHYIASPEIEAIQNKYKRRREQRSARFLDNTSESVIVETRAKASFDNDPVGLLNKLKELCAKFNKDPEDRRNALELVYSLKRAGIHSDASRICSAYLKRNPADKEFLEIRNKIALNQ